MPDITLSPIPYNGGTLSMTGANSHIVWLDQGKFLTVFAQTSPNYIFAAVVNVTNLKTGTASAAIPKQRVISQAAMTRVRLWKLSATRVLMLLNGDLMVLEVQPDDDVVVKNASVVGFHGTTTLWGAEAATAYSATAGSMIQGQYIKDNNVWIAQRTTTTGPIVLKKVVYDPDADTLNVTQMLQFAASATATHFSRFYMTLIPGTSNWFVYARGPNTTAQTTTTLSAFYTFDNDGNQLQAYTATGIPTTVRALVPLGPTKVLGLVDSRTYRYWNGTSWTATDTVFASGVTASTLVIHGEPIDSDYFMVLSTTTGTEMAAATPTYSFRVSRFVDGTFGQTSTATSTGNGLSYAIAGCYFDQEVMTKVDNEAFVIFGRASATQFRIRVLYQVAS